MSIVKFIFQAFQIAGETIRSSYCLLALAAMIVGGGVIAFSQNVSPDTPDSSQVIQFLAQTIDWYRHQAAVQAIATDPSDLMVVNDNRQVANQVVRLAFDFARAEAESPGEQGASQNQEPGADVSHYQALLQLEAKTEKEMRETQAEVDSLRQKLETTTGKKRQELQAQVAETQGELELTKARRDAIHSMTEFASETSGHGPGMSRLRAQIQALADSVPVVLSAPSNSNETTSISKEQPSSALSASANQLGPSGIWDLTAGLWALSQEIQAVDAAIRQTKALAKSAKETRAPLEDRLRKLSNQGDELAKEADSANQSELEQQKQQLIGLASQFKQISAAELPLSKQGILLDIYQRSLTNWSSAIRGRRTAEMEGLFVRLAILALILGMIIAAGELWRRAVYRYVHEPRRRYQFLLLRKFVLWLLIAVTVAVAFASRLGSVVTFAGLITAGVVVALQNVILSIVGYFLLIGKFGIRVGDRVQIGGVTGEVIDIGLVRLHLMELSSAEYIPTGRVVAFSNTVVFQPTAGLFKQIPGTDFLWHEITLRLSPDTSYDSLKERLLGVVETILADYREEMERQNRAIERSLTSTSANGFRPKAQVRFTSLALEVIIRFPVDLQQAAEIDERVTRELLRELEHEPKLKLATSDGPDIALRTDFVSGPVPG